MQGIKIPAIAVMYDWENQPSAKRLTPLYVVRGGGSVFRTPSEPVACAYANWSLFQGFTVRCSVRWVSELEAQTRAF